MKKVFLSVMVLSCLIASVAGAVSYMGRMGCTVMDSNRPLGLVFGIGEKAAFDVGVGFDKSKGYDLGYTVGAGIRTVMTGGEKANVYVRGAASYSTSPTGPQGTVDVPKRKSFGVMLQAGAEWFAADNVSFNVSHGVSFSSSKVGDGASSTGFGTDGDHLGNAGFTIWWGGK